MQMHESRGCTTRADFYYHIATHWNSIIPFTHMLYIFGTTTSDVSWVVHDHLSLGCQVDDLRELRAVKFVPLDPKTKSLKVTHMMLG